MFNPIQGPASPGQGPATADSTEHDSWYNAVAKINAMFKAVYTKLEGPIAHEVSVVDEEARAKFSALLTDLGNHVAALEERLKALEVLVATTLGANV